MLTNAIAQLTELLATVPVALSSISDEKFSAKPSLNEWSKKEILGHLIDSAANNHQRFIRLQYESQPSLFYDPDKWNELNQYQKLDTTKLIQFWKMYNEHLLHGIQIIEPSDYGNLCHVGQPELVTLEFLVTDYITHMKHHLNQLINE
jgi:hypothetical protein